MTLSLLQFSKPVTLLSEVSVQYCSVRLLQC